MKTGVLPVGHSRHNVSDSLVAAGVVALLRLQQFLGPLQHLNHLTIGSHIGVHIGLALFGLRGRSGQSQPAAHQPD